MRYGVFLRLDMGNPIEAVGPVRMDTTEVLEQAYGRARRLAEAFGRDCQATAYVHELNADDTTAALEFVIRGRPDLDTTKVLDP